MIFYALYRGSVYVQVMHYEDKSEAAFLERLKRYNDRPGNCPRYVPLPRKCLLRVMGKDGVLGYTDHWPLPFPHTVKQ
jgi:hypothetical protein